MDIGRSLKTLSMRHPLGKRLTQLTHRAHRMIPIFIIDTWQILLNCTFLVVMTNYLRYVNSFLQFACLTVNKLN